MARKLKKLSSILQKLLYMQRMNATDLARQTNLPVPTVHRLVTGKSTRPYSSSLQPIADYFSITIEQLIGETPIAGLEINYDQIRYIPVIPWENISSVQIKLQPFLSETVTLANADNNAFALIMKDHSMEPLFPKQTTLLFNPVAPIENRSFVLAKQNSEAVFRQLIIDNNQRYLNPLNTYDTEYEMQLLLSEDRILATLFESHINHNTANVQVYNESIHRDK